MFAIIPIDKDLKNGIQSIVNLGLTCVVEYGTGSYVLMPMMMRARSGWTFCTLSRSVIPSTVWVLRFDT